MTPPPAADEPMPDGLQFDQAEYDSPATTGLACASCRRPLTDAYFEINGQVTCDSCRVAILNHLARGSGFGRFARATIYGSAAAFLGFLIYFAILKGTGYSVGLISIVVGLIVGSAVRGGSRQRGGWLYQLLAVFLTYAAIGASYIAATLPEIIATVQNRNLKGDPGVEPAARGPGGIPKPGPVPKASAPDVPVVAPAPELARPHAPLANPPLLQKVKVKMEPRELILGILLLSLIVVVASLAAPIMVGFESPISLLIVGFALWEAWKLNRKTLLICNGPYHVGGDVSLPGGDGPHD